MLKKQFDELSSQIGSPYATVNYIANAAREKMSSTKYHIMESEAISWVLTGVEPKLRKRLDDCCLMGVKSILDEVLSSIDDVNVAKSVRKSYIRSLKEHHLIYCYHSSLNEYERSRVRILTKMVWYNME